MTADGKFSVSSELERRTTWFIRLRWLAAAGVVSTALAVRELKLCDLSIGPILVVAACLLLYNGVLYFVAGRLRKMPAEETLGANQHVNVIARLLAPRTFIGLGDEVRVARAALFAFAQINFDFFLLAVLLHFSGGVESPFATFFVFHVVLTSILLSRRATYLETTIGFLMFAAVVLGEYFGLLSHYPLRWILPADAYRTWSVAATSLAVLGATLYLASYLCSTIAVDFREGIRDNVLLSRQLAEDSQKLEIAYAKLHESERTKSQYMRKVAHELRGPLGTIETALNVLLEVLAGSLDEAARELICRAKRRASELAAVTHDLLLLARAREAALDERLVRVSVNDLVADVIADFKESAGRSGVTLSVDADCGAQIVGDPAAIRQLLANLVENGIRYTQTGGSVTVTLRPQDGRLLLKVEDTGIGIAPEDLARVFDEFYRGSHARQYAEQGTGLGLAIVKETAIRYGGTVDVESSLGHGTCFTVTLPTQRE